MKISEFRWEAMSMINDWRPLFVTLCLTLNSCSFTSSSSIDGFNDVYVVSSQLRQYFLKQNYPYFDHPESRRWMYYLRERFPEKTNPLKADHIAAIRAYTSGNSLYRNVNRSMKGVDDRALQEHKIFISALKEALELMPEDENLVHTALYRRLPDSLMDDFSQYDKGVFLDSPSFLSTSVSDFNMLEGDERRLVIKFNPSESNLLGKNIAELSAYPGEAEVLFPPGVRVVIESKLNRQIVSIGGEVYEDFVVEAKVSPSIDCSR